MTLDEGQRDERDGGEPGEDREAGGEAARPLLRETERGGEVEAADPAGHADEAGHHPDLGRKALRHELDYRAVAGTEREHRENEQAERRGERVGLPPPADSPHSAPHQTLNNHT